MTSTIVSRHDLESALVRLQGFIDIVDTDARAGLTDSQGLLESARNAIETLRTACAPLMSQEMPDVLKGNRGRVFLQYAMRLEADPLITALAAKRISPQWTEGLSFEVFQGSYEGLDVFIGVAGIDPVYQVDSIGSVPAAVLAHLGVKNLRPSLVINAGTCGGFQSAGHAIAQVFIGTQYVAFHHRRSSIPAMRAYGVGKYPVADSALLRSTLSLPDGVVSSGDALDYSKEDQEYMGAHGGTLKEMEAAAIGWICGMSKTPLLPIKTVTDWVDHPAGTAEQFKANYRQSVKSLTHEVVRVLGFLAEHPEDRIWA